MLLAARGAALNLSNNASVSVDFASNFRDLWTTKVGDGAAAGPHHRRRSTSLGSIVLNFTRFGRHMLAIGGNEEAARLAGLPVARTLIVVYALSGALAGLAGAFLASSGTGSPIAGIGWELTAIAAVVVGGTLLTGGRGSVGTTLVGVLLLGLIFNELNFERGKGTFDLPQYWEEIIRGGFLLDRRPPPVTPVASAPTRAVIHHRQSLSAFLGANSSVVASGTLGVGALPPEAKPSG